MIFLYGPSGSGKSSLGRILAERLNLPFVDLDQEIVRQSGNTIPDIFARQGEAGFRQIEKSVLNGLLRGKRMVVALGGGTLLDVESRARIERIGSVVCLSASLEQLLKRLEAEPDSRPLLAGEAHTRLQSLLADRSDHYASFEAQIDTDGRALDEIAWQVLRGPPQRPAGVGVTPDRGSRSTGRSADDSGGGHSSSPARDR